MTELYLLVETVAFEEPAQSYVVPSVVIHFDDPATMKKFQ